LFNDSKEKNMASIRYRAPWRVIVNGKTDPKGPFASEKQAQAYAAIVERDAIRDVVIAKTANRRVLGSLNDLAFQLQVGLAHFPDRSLLEHSLWLARTPLKLIEYGAPDRATVAAFATQQALQKASGR
jgi:hypothetical protein